MLFLKSGPGTVGLVAGAQCSISSYQLCQRRKLIFSNSEWKCSSPIQWSETPSPTGRKAEVSGQGKEKTAWNSVRKENDQACDALMVLDSLGTPATLSSFCFLLVSASLCTTCVVVPTEFSPDPPPPASLTTTVLAQSHSPATSRQPRTHAFRAPPSPPAHPPAGRPAPSSHHRCTYSAQRQ